MDNIIHTHSLSIEEKHLDSFGHVNNAVYLQLFEQARWDLLETSGYGSDKIQSTGLGPTILKIEISFLKELHVNDSIVIETTALPCKKKIYQIYQRMLRDGVKVCEATFTMGLFCLSQRRLVTPTEEWLRILKLD